MLKLVANTFIIHLDDLNISPNNIKRQMEIEKLTRVE